MSPVQETSHPEIAPQTAESHPFGWRRLVWQAPAGIAAMFAVLQLVLGPDPILMIITLVLAVLALVGWRFPRRLGPVVVLIGGPAFVLSNLPRVISGLPHPDSPLTFNLPLFSIVLTILAVLGAIGTLASWQRSARPVAVAGVAVMAVGGIGSLVANVAAGDAMPESGDVVVVTAGRTFFPPRISGSGEVTVYVDNTSPGRHTFTIDELGFEKELPGGTAQRFMVDAPPGTYTFRCTVPGHEGMVGVLTVTD